MFKQFKPKCLSMLGVDISPTSVKILELSKIDKQLRIEGYGYLKIPGNLVEANTINDKDLLTDHLKRLLLQINLRSKCSALAVPDALIIRKIIRVIACLTKSELAELVQIEAKKYLDYSAAELNIDYALLGSNPKQVAMNDVLLVATGKENVNQRVDVLKSAGLEVTVVEVASFAIARVMTNQLNRELTSSTGSPLAVILEFGLVSTQLIIMKGKNVIHTQQVLHELPDFLLIWVAIKKVLSEFFTTTGNQTIERYFVAGELENLSELAHLIHQETGVSAVVVDPFKHMALGKNIDATKLFKLAPSFMIATGLAMRLCDGD